MREVKKNRKWLVLFVAVAVVLFVSSRAAYAAGCDQDSPDFNLNCIEVRVFPQILKSVISLVGIFSFIFIIRGGIAYTTAGGDSKAVESARKTITYAVLGLGLAVASFAIISVINTTFGANILRFVIPPPTP